MTVEKWTDDAGNTYSGTTIPEKIVGFSGIDPVFIPQGWSASTSDDTSTGGGTQDHEKLQNLLGGEEPDGTVEHDGLHFHLSRRQHYLFKRVYEKLTAKNGVDYEEAEYQFMADVLTEDTFNDLVNARIAAYLNNNP